MGDFLRDQRVPFLTIREEELDAINSDLQDVVSRANASGAHATLSYLLRYDGIGIVRTAFDEIKRSFGIAKKVERLIFYLKSPANNLGKGKYIEIRLDNVDPNNCLLLIADDDEAWVDSTFRRLSSRIEKYRNGNWVVHSSLIEFAVQLIGVFTGFAFSLIAANLLSPYVTHQYSFFILFIGLFLIFSNSWTYGLVLLGKVRSHFWPHISFKEKPIGFIGQAIIGFLITTFLTELMNISWRILTKIGSLVQN